MSTRCNIGIYEAGDSPINKPYALLYKHSDGYPDGIIPVLQPFCERFRDGRGLEDTEYLAAWLLFEFMAEHREWEKDFAKKHGKSAIDGMSFCGFGICGDRQLHGDIDYYYRVDPDKITVLAPHGLWEKYNNAAEFSNTEYAAYEKAKSDLNNWTAIKTVVLKKLAAV